MAAFAILMHWVGRNLEQPALRGGQARRCAALPMAWPCGGALDVRRNPLGEFYVEAAVGGLLLFVGVLSHRMFARRRQKLKKKTDASKPALHTQERWGKVLVCGLVQCLDFWSDLYIVLQFMLSSTTRQLDSAVWLLLLPMALSVVASAGEVVALPINLEEKLLLSVLCALNLHVLFVGLLMLETPDSEPETKERFHSAFVSLKTLETAIESMPIACFMFAYSTATGVISQIWAASLLLSVLSMAFGVTMQCAHSYKMRPPIAAAAFAQIVIEIMYFGLLTSLATLAGPRRLASRSVYGALMLVGLAMFFTLGFLPRLARVRERERAGSTIACEPVRISAPRRSSSARRARGARRSTRCASPAARCSSASPRSGRCSSSSRSSRARPRGVSYEL